MSEVCRVDALGEWVRDRFGLGDGPLTRTVGGRGADGEVWRLRVGVQEYALKRPFRSLDPDAVQREAALVDHLAAAGVEVPVQLRTPDGRLVVDVPHALGGGHARVGHWVEGEPVGERAPFLAAPLGVLLARLHRAAPATTRTPRAWYSTTRSPGEWADLADRSAGQPWEQALAARLGDLTAYADLAEAAGPGAGPFVLGHCDLHPENAVVGPDGSLRALDWEDCGPVEPARELAKAVVQWHVDGDAVDAGSVAATVAAYREAGGPAVLADRSVLAMVVCSEANFLAAQVRRVLEDDLTPHRREHVVADIEASLGGYLPTPAALDRAWAAMAG